MFIEVHDRITKSPILINVDQILLLTPDQDKTHCVAFFEKSDKWTRLAESYEEVVAMICDSGELTVKRFKLVKDMLEGGRITSNEARILLGLDEVE